MKQKIDVLVDLATSLNQRHISWALGGSMMLFLRGIVDEFDDIDILVLEADFDVLESLLPDDIVIRIVSKKDNCHSHRFLPVSIDGIDIDFIGGFMIKNNYFPLLEKDRQEYHVINGQKIYLHSLQEWLKYYQLMGRNKKVSLIQNILNETTKHTLSPIK